MASGSSNPPPLPVSISNPASLQCELTDLGRATTLALGQRLRHLYVEQLQFLPHTLARASEYYLRATPIVRALESLQQVFTGFYPPLAVIVRV